MDKTQCSNRFRLTIHQLPIIDIERRIIEIIFSLIGYLFAKKLNRPPILGTLFGGLVGMVISYLLLPETQVAATRVSKKRTKPLTLQQEKKEE